MDRTFYLSASSFQRYWPPAMVLCLACTMCATLANAQGRGRGGGGFSFGGDSGGGDFLQRMDRNENGRLDEDEIPEGMRGILESQGVDVSEGVSFEDFGSARESMRVQFQSGGGFNFNFRGGDEEEENGRSEQSRDEGSRDGDSRRSRSRDNDDDDEEKPRPRVTFDLPASHSPADTDGDGQVAMYEWRRWSGHSLREFLEMDGNGDGFVTPREVYIVIGFPEADSSSTSTRTVASVPSSSGRSGATTSAAPASASSTPAGSASALTAEANRYFGILDKDGDGALSLEEWGSSIRIRGMFEEGAVDLSQPMPSATFVEHYVRLSSQAG